MTDADTTRTQTTTYVVQFKGAASGRWVNTADGPFDGHEDALAWIAEHIQGRACRILKQTTLLDVVVEFEEVA